MGFEPYSSPLWAREEYVRVVYNPVDGQYKASVKIAWDAQHPGVRAVTVARPGAAVVQNSAVQPIQDAGQASPGSGVPRAGRIRVKGQPRLPAPHRRATPAPRMIPGCCHVAVNPAIGFAGQARKCLELLEPTGGLEPPAC